MSRLHHYLTANEAYEGWLNSTICHYVYLTEKPLNLNDNPFLRTQCRQMFDHDVSPGDAAQWIVKLLPIQRNIQSGHHIKEKN